MQEAKWGKIKIFFEDGQNAPFVDNVRIGGNLEHFTFDFLQLAPSTPPGGKEFHANCVSRIIMTTSQAFSFYNQLGKVLKDLSERTETALEQAEVEEGGAS